MGFNNGNKFNGGKGGKKYGGKKSFDKPSFGGSRDYDKKGGHSDMHRATCSDCGASCEVPFRPTGTRPVLCNDCFRNSKSDHERSPRSGGDRGYNERGPRPRFDEKFSPQRDSAKSAPNYDAQFDQVNRKLDKLMGLFEIISSQTSKKSPASKQENIEEVTEKGEGTEGVKKTPAVKKVEKADLKAADSKKTKAKKAPAKKAVVTKKAVVKKGK